VTATPHINTLELIALQNQLLLATGGSFNAREALHTFMKTALQSLALKSIHLYTFEQSEEKSKSNKITRYLSVPDNNIETRHQEQIIKLLKQFKKGEVESYASEKLENKELLAFAFGNFGMLLMEKNQGNFQDSLKDSLVPIILKLSVHYYLCEQQKHLNQELQINKDTQLNYEIQAKRDPLTNLPNRREFRYSLSKEISNSQRYGYYGALMYIDLDNFKNVNDSLGHSVGDILLTQVAQRLTTQARQGDNVYRIGGDEFVYILSNIGDTDANAISTSRNVANRVIDTLSSPIEIGEYSLHITPSIGIAIFPDEFDDGNDSETVLQHADTAMYRAKKQGRNCYEFFNPEMHVEANKRLVIEDHLRKAITNNELTMFYQPIVNIEGKIIGAESLVRWNNPILGNVRPDQFISIAEESNLILSLSKWITEHSCRFAEGLCKQLPADSDFSYISINISARQFLQNDFVESITDILDTCDLPEGFIKLEFTESVLLDNLESTIDKMEKLRDKNIEFLLDDFGTGFSSLSYLHKLPIWLLKIDKSFIADFCSNNMDAKAIVNAIMVMAEQLNIKCIIEGVEVQEHVDYFTEKGVYGMQGFFFHKPMPGHELEELLAGQKLLAANEANG
jgi:diguanylate cyclase (GGDEF)-like protein